MEVGHNENQIQRNYIITRTAIIGILTNVFLATFKAFAGLLSGSIAITLDALNNLTDAISAIVTIVGIKLAEKKPDIGHPFGHGRMEYLATMAIAALISYVGITSIIESVRDIIKPSPSHYTSVSIWIMIVAIFTKIILGNYYKKVGKSVNSDSLVASGKDATFDAIITSSVLFTAFLYYFFHFSLEAWLGVIISLLIIKSGIEMMTETTQQILGPRANKELTQKIKTRICSFPGVHGAYDLILHNYGPERFVGTIHVGVLDTMSMTELDDLQRHISETIYKEFDILLTGISIYSINTKDDAIRLIQTNVTKIILAHEGILEIHGFYANPQSKTIHFDIVLDFSIENSNQLADHILEKVKAAYPDFHVEMTADVDA